jgi:hypothetical protein
MGYIHMLEQDESVHLKYPKPYTLKYKDEVTHRHHKQHGNGLHSSTSTVRHHEEGAQ